MKNVLNFIVILVIATVGYLSRATLKQKTYDIKNIFSRLAVDSVIDTSEVSSNTTLGAFDAHTLLKGGNGILFVETSDRMEPPSLVLCALESAARVYPDRPVVFFMKGLGDILNVEEENRAKEHFPTLSSFHNIFFFPLRMAELFHNTPLMHWFTKVDPKQELCWTHVSSDACRFALMWKYGGIYMDADVISMRPIPKGNFLAAEAQGKTSSSVFGLSRSHQVTWQLMENFVENYRGEIWAYQGPGVFTRVVTKLCGMPVFTSMDDVTCANVPYFHPLRVYPIQYSSWEKYFEVWPEMPTFSNSYALHLWNFMNKEGKTMVPGSNTLVERLYQQYCPTTYGFILRQKRLTFNPLTILGHAMVSWPKQPSEQHAMS